MLGCSPFGCVPYAGLLYSEIGETLFPLALAVYENSIYNCSLEEQNDYTMILIEA